MSNARPLPSEQRALLAAVVAAPDDDVPRLVYADWLEENGDPTQAGFIRDSIWLAANETADAEWEALTAVSRRHGYGWLRDIGISGPVPKYIRGMAEFLRYTGSMYFLHDAEAGLFDLVPVRQIAIEGDETGVTVEDGLRRMARMTDMRRLLALRLEGFTPEPIFELDPEPWRDFIRSPAVSGLRWLSLSHCDPAAIIELAASPALSELRRLDVEFAWDSSPLEAQRAVASSAHLAKLSEFRIRGGRRGEDHEDVVEIFELLRNRFGRRWRGHDISIFNPPLPGEYTHA